MATLQSVQEGEDTFTRTRILEVLEKGNFTSPATWEPQFEVQEIEWELRDDGKFGWQRLSAETAHQRARDWCRDMHARFRSSHSSLQSLEESYARLLGCNFQEIQQVDRIANRVIDLLRRLPEVPLEFHDPKTDPPYTNMPSDCFLPGSEPMWNSLRVARSISRNVICMAIEMQLHRSSLRDSDYETLINLTSEMLRITIDIFKAEPSIEWFFIKAFLWTSWQRMMTMYYDRRLRAQLGGFDSSLHLNNALKGADIFNAGLNYQSDPHETYPPPYMCNWALKVLREDKAIVGRDFRRFFQIFSYTFAGHTPRCSHLNNVTPISCDGRRPKSCLRLFGMTIENQSAHSIDCSGGCPRLYWNEGSWQAVGGGAAVALSLGPDDSICYIPASDRTLAISHVWSHGQGGRPENNPANEGTGFNSCLHHRYTKIARSYGCDSYWMDTPCIPTNHSLRNDAIANINRVFMESKMTLICDKDLMAIDVHNFDIAAQESILATVLVCDWNVRAWTTLEALRGRKSLYIICKDDRIVSLQDVAQRVCQSGAMELSALFLSAQHLIPIRPDNRPIEQRQQFKRDDSDTRFTDVYQAADLLSYRHASRLGDEIVIWSLLSSDRTVHDIKDLWRTREHVRTGWLVSDLPRMKADGLSWAPSHPSLRNPGLDYDKILIPYDGLYSNLGKVYDVGLEATWWAYGFSARNRRAKTLKTIATRRDSLQMHRPTRELWSKIQLTGLVDNPKEVSMALLKPLHASTGYPLHHPRKPSKHIFVVVASDNQYAAVPRNQRKEMPLAPGDYTTARDYYNFRKWRWKGILELDEGTVPSGFHALPILIS